MIIDKVIILCTERMRKVLHDLHFIALDNLLNTYNLSSQK